MRLPGSWGRLWLRNRTADGGNQPTAQPAPGSRLVADGGEREEDSDESAGDDGDATGETDAAREAAEGGELDRSNVEVTAAGEAEPADPKWEKPDPEDIPEFEVRAEEPVAGGAGGRSGDEAENPTAGMPNTAGSPGTRISAAGTEGYVAALELCARLPDDVRLPAEAAEIVPAAVEAELEDDVQSFAAAEFDNPSPHVEVLDFEEVDDEIWMRLRLGVPGEAFADLDPDAIRAYALQELEGLL